MAHNSISFLAALQALDHGDHGDHTLHGDFIARSGAPSGGASALVMSHAVLSGPWMWDQKDRPDHLPFDAASNAQLWAADVRTMVAQQEIGSSVRVTATPGGGGALPTVSVSTTTGSAHPLIAALERPDADTFAAQLDLLEFYADQRVERLPEIILELSDIISNFAAIVPLRPERKRWTLEYIRICLRAISLVEMQVKHIMACRRPVDFHAQVQPMIQTPQHSALPAGHAAEAFLVSTLLRHFAETAAIARNAAGEAGWFAKADRMLLRQAARIAQNRVVAGVHFPIDNACGAVLGVSFAEYLLALSQGPAGTVTTAQGRSFVAGGYGGADFTHETAAGLYGAGALHTSEGDVYSESHAVELTPPDNLVLGEIYRAAAAEWQDPA
ncbi:MAG: phosphatase PAP2 family protein [Pseudomonadota bacterium]